MYDFVILKLIHAQTGLLLFLYNYNRVSNKYWRNKYGKLDDMGGTEPNSGSGQIMAFINEPTGRICSWGIPLAESYGVRLPIDYCGEIPSQMQMMDVPQGEYIVFEHGPFNFQTQNQSVEQKIEAAMKNFDYNASGYCLDTTQGRVFYFYHDPERFWKYIRPVKKL